MPSLATFNANNFFLRYKFSRTYPGDQSRASLIAAGEAAFKGYLPGTAFGKYPSNYIIWDTQRRELAARALKEPDGHLPDILCLQEVENIQAIRTFNQRHLDDYYPYSFLVDAYDPRNIDVGLLSRFPIREIRSHIDEFADGERLFSRDCLEATVELPDATLLTLFINHLKSKFVKREADMTDEDYRVKLEKSHNRRQVQAEKVVAYLQQRFQGRHDTALYAVLGDMNDTTESPYVQALVTSNLLTDVLAAHRPAQDRWTYYWRSKNRGSQIDYLLVSQAMAARLAAAVASDPAKTPHIERQGLAYRELNHAGLVLPRELTVVSFEEDEATPRPPGATPNFKVDFRFPRYPEVMADWRANISDHCPVKIWF